MWYFLPNLMIGVEYMVRYEDLTTFEKFVVIAMIVFVAVFAVLYIVTTSQRGYSYHDTILVHRTENGNTVYAGEINHQEARFTVSADGAVTFVYGDKTYGPYTVKEDPTAMPTDKGCIRGIEVRDQNEILFRGGYAVMERLRFYYNEDGSSSSIGFAVSSSNDGIVKDANGNIVDTMKPSVSTILDLVDDPKLEHRGSWWMRILGTFLAGITVISVIFADALFRLRLSWHVQDVDMVEPSTWELARRTFSWISALILIPIVYIIGLQ